MSTADFEGGEHSVRSGTTLTVPFRINLSYTALFAMELFRELYCHI